MGRLLLVLLLLVDVGTADDSVTCALNTPRFYDPSTGCYPGPVQNSYDPDTVLFWEVVEGYRVYYVCPEPGHKVCRSKGKDKKSPDQFSCYETADLCEAGYFCSEGSGDFWPAALSGPLGERVGCWDKVNKPTPYSSGVCVAESSPPRIVYTDVACDVAHRPWHPVEGCVEVERDLPFATTEIGVTIGEPDWGIAFYETVLNNDGETWTHVVYDDPTTSKAEIPAEWPHKLAVLHSPASRGIRTLLRRYVKLNDPSNAGSRGAISSTNATMATTMNTTKATTTTTTRSTTTERPWSDEELMHINSFILCMVALLFLTTYFKCKKYEAPPRVTWLEVTTPEDAHPQNPPKQPDGMAKSARSSATV
ncbi:unnamed protein product, partial [Mesorhabditis spiculigera]